MKIYVGKNKKNAKETSLKDLIESCIKSDTINVTNNGSFEDNSASWLDVRKMSNKKLRADDKKNLNDAMMTSIAGISAAMKNTG